MNNVPNSDSEQCTESRLGQVHRVHTQRTLAARMVCLGRARTAPCRGTQCAVLQAQHRPCCRRVAQCRVPARPCRGCLATPSVQAERCIVTHKAAPSAAIQFVSQLSLASPRSCHDTNDCIVTHLSSQAALLSWYN